MLTLLTILHVLVCVFLIVIVLLQHGKGADMGASFGGGSGKTVFGTEGPLPLLNKITTASAIIFMLTSVTLAFYSANSSKSSVMKALQTVAPVEKSVEVAPTPVEVPMTNSEGAKVDDKGTAPAQFPGAKAPVAAEPAPAAAHDKAANQAPSQGETKETVPAPVNGQ
jgi:preprotein translocase subunit SecG